MNYAQKMCLAIAANLALPTIALSANWDLPSAFPDGNFHTQNLRWFADQVAQATNKDLNITVHSNAALFSADEIKVAVQTGQTPIGEICICHYGNEYAFYEADGIPFLAQGYDEAWKLWQAQRPVIEERLAKEGLMVLYAVAWPGQGFYTKKTIESVDDFKGVRIRSDYPPLTRLAELVGAEPVTVRGPEVPTAFGTGMIEAMYTSPTTGVNSQAWDFVDYYYDIRANHPKNLVIVNRAAFEALSEESRTAVLKAAEEAERRGWKLSEEKSTEDLNTLKEKGINVLNFSDSLLTAMKGKGNEVIDSWLERLTPDERERMKNLRGQ
ncbi:MAG: TRAP transporter substrate-binding protein [Rhizobiaceae bacterium]|nr:TRAP transporter substrate-binding protein [Rhizobiaceae bacterium]